MKASPLLRAWLLRLRQAGVAFHVRHAWRGWSEDGALRFETPQGEQLARARAVVLALGGGSWPRLGSDGAWVPLLVQHGVEVLPLRRPIVALTWGGRRIFARALPGNPSSPCLSFTDSKGSAFCQPANLS